MTQIFPSRRTEFLQRGPWKNLGISTTKIVTKTNKEAFKIRAQIEISERDGNCLSWNTASNWTGRNVGNCLQWIFHPLIIVIYIVKATTVNCSILILISKQSSFFPISFDYFIFLSGHVIEYFNFLTSRRQDIYVRPCGEWSVGLNVKVALLKIIIHANNE